MPPILTSKDETVVLRPARHGDGAGFIALGWSAEIHRMFGGSRTTPQPDRRKVAAGWLRSVRRQPCAWVIQHQGQLIGQIRLNAINQIDKRARLAVGILTEDRLGQGVGRAAIRLVLGHAFESMGLNRVDLRVLEFNERAIRCYKSCGFVEEGRERQSACIGGIYYDDVMMGVLAQEFSSGVCVGSRA